MFPNVDDEDLAGGESEESALPFKILVFSSFSTICAFNIHDKNVLGHIGATLGSLVLAHPYSFCCLTAFLLRHDTELGAKEVVEKSGFARRLGAKDGNEMVVEAGRDDLFEAEICVEVGAA